MMRQSNVNTLRQPAVNHSLALTLEPQVELKIQFILLGFTTTVNILIPVIWVDICGLIKKIKHFHLFKSAFCLSNFWIAFLFFCRYMYRHKIILIPIRLTEARGTE